MLNPNEDKIRTYLKELREAHRETILATRGADWRQELPIMAALARAEREQGTETPEGDNLSSLGMFEPIDVGLSQPDAIAVDSFQYAPPAPSSPDIPTPTSPTLSMLPDMESSALVGQQDPAPADPILSNPAETLASVKMEAPISQPSPSSRPSVVDKLEAATKPPRPTQSQEKIELRRQAMHKAANIPVPPRQPQQAGGGRDPIAAMQVQPEHTMPFLQGPMLTQPPDALISDGANTPHDIAKIASAAGDTTEMTTLMLGETLDRIVTAMLKLQAQMNNISSVLERSFNT